ncbi:OmpP1/FadL family transporter [Imhoffiella purpurea]|uniref:Long-chain fatty acid transport protein n=1 Tax=Imhoffiella purpurea TaxID=1249627 RepID=W9VAG7_9GAMM|nr:OmpP1/FadL family transporter [Imhoffiella purpurea]EXJ13886.1 Long-chain fatty acid transport protein [Imhoffiella purpurea]
MNARAILAATVLGTPALTAASGFALVERDAAGLGRAYAGQAAVSGPEAISFNPAGLPERPSLSLSVHALRNRIEPEDAGEPALVPTLYGSRSGIGVGLYSTFGLATDYPDDWSGRYVALHSEIRTARAHLAGAWSVTPGLRLGAGLFVQQFTAELTSAYPLGARDGRITIEGEDLGLGWSVGALWSPTDRVALGLAYGSAVRHTLRGKTRLPSGAVSSRVDVTTPETVALGLRWSALPELTLLAGATWTRWSRMQSLDVELANGLTLTEDHQWRDTWRLDLGGEYEHGPWTLRLGIAWDQSPVRDAAHRSPRLPDSDRVWLAAGLGYRRGAWTFNASVAHLWFADRRGEHPPLDYSGSTDILALGVARSW